MKVPNVFQIWQPRGFMTCTTNIIIYLWDVNLVAYNGRPTDVYREICNCLVTIFLRLWNSSTFYETNVVDWCTLPPPVLSTSRLQAFRWVFQPDSGTVTGPSSETVRDIESLCCSCSSICRPRRPKVSALTGTCSTVITTGGVGASYMTARSAGEEDAICRSSGRVPNGPGCCLCYATEIAGTVETEWNTADCWSKFDWSATVRSSLIIISVFFRNKIAVKLNSGPLIGYTSSSRAEYCSIDCVFAPFSFDN